MNRRIANKIVKRTNLESLVRWRWRRLRCRGYTQKQIHEAIRKADNRVLFAVVEKPHLRSMWGRDRLVHPVFIAEKFGNGDQMVWLSPIMGRPNYFGVRVDSRWNDDQFRDALDEIYEAIEDLYPPWSVDRCEECEDGSCETCLEEREFPYCGFADGSSWGFWP